MKTCYYTQPFCELNTLLYKTSESSWSCILAVESAFLATLACNACCSKCGASEAQHFCLKVESISFSSSLTYSFFICSMS